MTIEFRFQNSINLSLGLIAAACALMAGALTAFFSMADKVPHNFAGAMLVLTCILTLLLCAASLVFGGRGISATLHAAQAQPPPQHYDKGNFNRQAIAGGLGVLAVVGMVVLSLVIKGENAAQSAVVSASAQKATAETAGHLAAQDSRISELSQRIDQLTVQQDALAKDVSVIKSQPSSQTAAQKRVRSGTH
jgi:hypothetical protein